MINDIEKHIKIFSGEERKEHLFHGSKTGIIGEITLCFQDARDACDFGKGFYLGSNRDQAISLVTDRSSAIIYDFSLDLRDLKCGLVSGPAWLCFISSNRGWFSEESSAYLDDKIFYGLKDCDVIIGEIADDRMETMLVQFKKDALTDQAFAACLKSARLGMQYALKTDSACQNLELISKKKMNPEEKRRIANRAFERWNKNMETMSSTRRSYLRQGRYFSEMTEELEEQVNAQHRNGLHL